MIIFILSFIQKKLRRKLNTLWNLFIFFIKEFACSIRNTIKFFIMRIIPYTFKFKEYFKSFPSFILILISRLVSTDFKFKCLKVQTQE